MDLSGLEAWLFKILGAFMGVVASLVIIAPLSVRNAIYRGIVGLTMGVIFAPILSNAGWFSFFHGPGNEMIMARSAAMGFVIYFVLEIIARLLSSEQVISALVDELIRLRAQKGKSVDGTD